MTGSLEPTNEGYALAKITGIKLLEAYRKQRRFESITLIPSNLYGPGDSFDLERSHVLSALVKRFCDARRNLAEEVQLWGTGNARREFMHVDDFARAVLLLILEEEIPIINVGSGVDLSIRELADMVAKTAGFDGRVCWDATQPDGMPRKLLDVSKLRSLGFRCNISLNQGISQMVDQYSNGNL